MSWCLQGFHCRKYLSQKVVLRHAGKPEDKVGETGPNFWMIVFPKKSLGEVKTLLQEISWLSWLSDFLSLIGEPLVWKSFFNFFFWYWSWVMISRSISCSGIRRENSYCPLCRKTQGGIREPAVKENLTRHTAIHTCHSTRSSRYPLFRFFDFSPSWHVSTHGTFNSHGFQGDPSVADVKNGLNRQVWILSDG